MTDELEHWTYDRRQRFDEQGRRWHFVSHRTFGSGVSLRERPYELYFRDEDRTEFGVLRFARSKDNPYRGYEGMVAKILKDPGFRQQLLDPETARVWKRGWK